MTWEGEIPRPPDFNHWDEDAKSRRDRPNPNSPALEPASRGVAKAMVFIREVNLSRSRPWDHESVRVILRDKQFHIFQGLSSTAFGLVRRGDSIAMANWDPWPHQARGRGTAFFGQPLVDLDSAGRRVLKDKGVVELSSGTGHYWMRAYLFVDDHPYYAATDAAGHFTLLKVPAGTYRLACWMPNWRVARKDRDQETTQVTAVEFAPSMEQEQNVEVRAGKVTTAHFQIAAKDFPTP